MQKHEHIGGQAVIEGVMMKSSRRITTAVRKKGKIFTKTKQYKSLLERSKLFRLPVIRGIISLFEMLVVGIRSLNWSAKQFEGGEETIGAFELTVTFALSIIATVLIFIVAPYYLTKIFVNQPSFTFNLIDGGFRVAIFLLYLALIGMMKDIKRVFQYHGAEHKAVNCFEAHLKLTPENCQKFSTVHVRCGTSLLVFVIIISILFFSLIHDPRWFVNIPLRILFIPLIAGVSYELLKLSAKLKDCCFLSALIAPGLWTQKLTTREPSKKQLEVAIAALKKVI